MEELKNKLSLLLMEYDALIQVDEEEGFLYLKLVLNKTSEESTIDSGYRDLNINSQNLSTL